MKKLRLLLDSDDDQDELYQRNNHVAKRPTLNHHLSSSSKVRDMARELDRLKAACRSFEHSLNLLKSSLISPPISSSFSDSYSGDFFDARPPTLSSSLAADLYSRLEQENLILRRQLAEARRLIYAGRNSRVTYDSVVDSGIVVDDIEGDADATLQMPVDPHQTNVSSNTDIENAVVSVAALDDDTSNSRDNNSQTPRVALSGPGSGVKYRHVDTHDKSGQPPLIITTPLSQNNGNVNCAPTVSSSSSNSTSRNMKQTILTVWTPEEEDHLIKCMDIVTFNSKGQIDWTHMRQKNLHVFERFNTRQIGRKASNIRTRRERLGVPLGPFEHVPKKTSK